MQISSTIQGPKEQWEPVNKMKPKNKKTEKEQAPNKWPPLYTNYST